MDNGTIKRVLLLGDCSAVHRNLCDGLCNLGIDAVDASYGNAWRKLGSSLDLGNNIFGLPSVLSRNIAPFVYLDKLKGYDVVQFIQYKNNFNPRFGIDKYLTKKIIASNKKTFLVATSCDPFVQKYFSDKSRGHYFPKMCAACLHHDLHSNVCPCDSKENERELKEFIKLTGGVIPTAFEYAEAYRNSGCSTLLKTIPLPMNTDKVTYGENRINGKLVIFHGINRVGFKGSDIVNSAFENITNKYPNDVEAIVDGKMPLAEYLQVLSRTNVVVDQIYGITYGMNAVYSMVLGKVVVGGGHPQGITDYGVDSSPMIPVQPEVKSVEKAIEGLLDRKKEIAAMGFASRKYVEQVHHYELVAKKYLETWKSNL